MNQFGSIQVREGDVVGGKYRIERLLGAGGMGVVVAARHEQLDQLVAIKFVRDDALDNDEAVERFIREARSAARLRSEHVARVLDVGRLESGAPYMVMEFLDGHDLAHALTHDGPMAVDLAAALMMQVCEAVAEAHAAGIVHRDLKPENLFLTRTVGGSPKMKVLDFGVSKSVRLASDPKAKLTRTSTMLGSPLYMAPEQMRSSRDVDARGDVWALGVVLFELLTGRSPFEAETMPELCLKIVSEPPLSLAELRPVIPAALVAVVERCLEKDRDKRYENAAALALALSAFQPPRSSVFSAPLPSAGDRPAPSFAATPPQSAPISAGPPRVASIPAAWGTEGRQESQQPAPRRTPVAAWVAVASLAIGAAVVAVAVNRPRARAEHPASEMPSSLPPPATTEIAPPIPETLTAIPDGPPVVEAVASAATPVLSADPSNRATVLRSAPSTPAAPRSVRPAPRASAVGGALARPDDDIPSLR